MWSHAHHAPEPAAVLKREGLIDEVSLDTLACAASAADELERHGAISSPFPCLSGITTCGTIPAR